MKARDVTRLLERAKENIDAALQVVDASPPERPIEPFDGLPRVRPHTRKGEWQVWSGGICIALLSAEDVAPIKESR